MAAFSRAGSRGRGRALPRSLLVSTVAVMVWLLAGPTGAPGAFTAPRSSGTALTRRAGQAPAVEAEPAAATAVASEEEAEAPALAAQVEALRNKSLEACMLATEEDPTAVEHCSVLSYELSQAEQLLFKRQAAFRYADNDSF